MPARGNRGTGLCWGRCKEFTWAGYRCIRCRGGTTGEADGDPEARGDVLNNVKLRKSELVFNLEYLEASAGLWAQKLHNICVYVCFSWRKGQKFYHIFKTLRTQQSYYPTGNWSNLSKVGVSWLQDTLCPPYFEGSHISHGRQQTRKMCVYF